MRDETIMNGRGTNGFVLWAGRHGHCPLDLAVKMGISAEAVRGLLNASQPFTYEALGRFGAGFGIAALQELLRLGDLPDGVTVVALDGPADGRVVPSITSRVANLGVSRIDGTVIVSTFSMN